MNWPCKYQLYLFLLLIHNASTSETNGSNVISDKHFAVEIPKPIIPFDLPDSDTEYIRSRTFKSRTWNAQKSKRPSMVDIALDIAAGEGIDAMTDLYQNIEPRIAKNGQLLEDNHPAALLSKFSAPLEGSEHSAMAAFATLSATKAFRRNNKESDVLGRQAQAQKVSFRRTPLEGLCPPRDPPTCMPASQRYRTHDGTCNNRRRLRWGSAQMPFNRFLPPEYGDRVDSIRESIEGGPLSSSRFVSLLVHGAREGEAPLTLMTVQWGQLLDHDLTSTAQPRSINGSVPSCCGSKDFHPSCFPIKVPLDDPWLAPLKVRCLEFLRSAAAQRRDCVLSWREQTNQITSYIDASPIYSSNAKTSDNARIFRNGLLVYGRGDPKEDVCMRGALAHQCIRSGDGRSGEQPGLLALHHVWVGEHNRIAMELSMLNPHWSDEKVYQETRRIIGALFQHITYREFLPIVLGREVCKLFDLELVKTGYFTGYDQNTNPTVSNAFAAAAFRFGHSLVQNSYMRCDRHHNFINNNVTLHEEFQQGDIGTAGSLHRLLRGLATQRALKRDEFITPELTNHLFQTPGFPFGLDLAAINIQRGRDHGIAPYTAWRQPCGLSAINTWDDLSNVVGPGSAKRISHAYRNVHDIDLFVGGIAERPVVGGLVGPTFACIIAQQFSNSRKGDRFWYENSGFESSFTPAQLNSLRHVSLASVLCRALNGGTLQPHVFIPSDVPGNQRVKCGKESLEPIDLSPWLEQDPFLSEKIDVQVNNDPSLPSPMEMQTNKEEKGINNRLQNLTMVANVDFIPNSSIGFHRVPNMTKIHDKLDMAQKVVARPFVKPIRGISNKLDKNRLTIKNPPKSTVSPLAKRTTPRRTVVIHNVEIELRSASGVKEQTDYSKQTSVKHDSIASTAQNTIMKVAGVVRSQMNAALGFLKGSDDALGSHSSRQLNDKQLTSNVDTTVKQINTNLAAEILMTTEPQKTTEQQNTEQQNTDQQNTDQQPPDTNGFSETTELTEQHEVMTESTNQTSNNLDGQHLVSDQTPNLKTKQLNNDKVNLIGFPELIIRLDNKTDTNTLTSSSTENFKSYKTFEDNDSNKINGPTKTILRNLTDSPPDKNSKSFRSKEVFANRRQRAQTTFREDYLTNNHLRIQNKTNLDTTTTRTTSNRNYSTLTEGITKSAETSSDSYDTYKDFQAIIDSALQDPLDQHKRVHRKTDFQMHKMEIRTNLDFSDKLQTLRIEKSNKPTTRQLKKTTFQIAAKIVPDQELEYKNYTQPDSNLTFHNANLTFRSTTELPATLRNVELRQFQERPIYNRPQKLILDGPESDQYEIEINIRQTNTKPPNYYANNPEYSPNKRYDSDRYVSSHHYDHQQSLSTSPSDNYFTQTTRIPYVPRTKPPTIIYIDEHDERTTTTRAPGFFQNIISFASNGINSIRQQPTSTNGPFNPNRITNSDNYPSSQPPRPYQHSKPSSGNYQLPQPQPYPPPHVFPQQGFPQQGFPQQGPLGFNPNVGPSQIGPPVPFYPPQPLPGANSFSTSSNFGGTAHATSSALSTGHFGAIAGSAASSGGDSTFSFNIRPSSRPHLNLVQPAGNKPDYELLPQRRPQFSSTPSYANPPKPISSAENLHYPPNKHDPFSSHTRRPPTHYAKHPNNVFDVAYDDIGRSDLKDDESIEISTNTNRTTDENTSSLDSDDYDYNDDDDDDDDVAYGNIFKTYSFVESGEDDKIDYLKLAEQTMTNITKPNATTQFDDNFVMPVLRSSDEKLEERTVIKDSNETNPSDFPIIEQKSFHHDILAEDYDELALGRSSFLDSQIAAASRWDKVKGPVDNVPVAFAPIKVLTKPERPDNWVIYDTPDDKKPVLPDQPDYDTETLTAAEVPMPLKKPKISHSSKLRTSLSVQKDDKDRSTTTDETSNTKLDETTVTVEEMTEDSRTNVATNRTIMTTNNETLNTKLDETIVTIEERTEDSGTKIATDRTTMTTNNETLNTKLDETTVTIEERTEDFRTNIATDRTTMTTNNLTEELDGATNEVEKMTTDVNTITEQTVTEITQTENNSMNTKPTNQHYDRDGPIDENIPNLT